MICRVGVTGHRPWRLRENHADPVVLRRRVDEVLRDIAFSVAELRTHEARLNPYAEGPQLLRVVSALAEGSDRIVARSALELQPEPYELQCVLPFPAATYRRDFSERSEWEEPGSAQEFDELLRGASAVLELEGDRDAPNAYAPVGLTIVRQCDVLLAIWDAGPPRGPGGTPEVVLEALRANIPVIGIDARRSHDHAIAFLELRRGAVAWTGWSRLELKTKLRTVLVLPPQPEHEEPDHVAPAGRVDLAHAFFSEPDTAPARTTLYSGVTRMAARLTGDSIVRPLLTPELDAFVHTPRQPERAATADAQLDGLLSAEVQRDVPSEQRSAALSQLVLRLEAAAGHAFEWADRQANRYAALHRRHVARSTLLLVPIAVVTGFLVQRCFNPGITGESWNAVLLRVALSLLELGVLLAIFDSYVTVREQRYHDRWLDYRSIAEKLRHVLMLIPLGRPGIDAELPPTLGENDPRSHWTNWYIRAVTREVGVFSGSLADPAYRQACHTLLRHWLVRGQIRYHFHAAARAHAPRHMLHRYRYLIFAFVVLSPVLELALEPVPQHLYHTREIIECSLQLIFFCVPAIYGSWYAFLRLADFENIEVRSRAELQRLVRVEHELSEQADQSSAHLLRATSMTSHAMLAELVEWRVATALRAPDLGH